MKREKRIYTIEEATQEKWLDSYEVKRMFNISETTLYRLRKNNEIPFTRLGKKYLYPQALFSLNLLNKINDTKK